ncbi:MAG: sigma-70 family RNA polymerase sigma factor [Clostridia bacterium]|nr:sigma-70 family RNA polymerase sigma factor [Clostridia bacterium]
MKTNEILKLIGDKEFLDKIYQFSYRRCNTSYEAEDLCSDIILAVISAVHNQEGIENFYAFVWAIARRVYADYSEKRNQTRQTISIENGDLFLAAKENEIDSFIEEAAEQEQIKKIFAEISFLSKAYREVMVLYYLDEMKVKDIALKLGINETTVKQRLFSARNTVRREVENMNERNLSLKPIRLAIVGTGNPMGNDPRTKADRVLSQNLIYLCKDKAKTAKELSEELCVPMPYIEDELEIQVYGENGKYGMLRKLDNGKYITNILLVDYSEYDEANKIYEKHLDEYIPILKNNFEKQKQDILLFPYLSKQSDATFILWGLISRTIWIFEKRVKEVIGKNYFSDVEPVKREFTTVATAFRDDMNPNFGFYGCDGIQSNSVWKYRYVHFSNIYGARKEKHFACGHNITNDDKLLLTLKALDGTLSIDELNDTEKEVAAKAIECGYIKKCGKILLPQIVAYEKKFDKAFHNMAIALNENTEALVERIAKELSEFMRKHIPEHLMNEYEYYIGCIAGVRFLHETIEACIKEGLLCEPENKIGAEGVLMVIEK